MKLAIHWPKIILEVIFIGLIDSAFSAKWALIPATFFLVGQMIPDSYKR